MPINMKKLVWVVVLVLAAVLIWMYWPGMGEKSSDGLGELDAELNSVSSGLAEYQQELSELDVESSQSVE